MGRPRRNHNPQPKPTLTDLADAAQGIEDSLRSALMLAIKHGFYGFAQSVAPIAQNMKDEKMRLVDRARSEQDMALRFAGEGI